MAQFNNFNTSETLWIIRAIAAAQINFEDSLKPEIITALDALPCEEFNRVLFALCRLSSLEIFAKFGDLAECNWSYSAEETWGEYLEYLPEQEWDFMIYYIATKLVDLKQIDDIQKLQTVVNQIPEDDFGDCLAELAMQIREVHVGEEIEIVNFKHQSKNFENSRAAITSIQEYLNQAITA